MMDIREIFYGKLKTHICLLQQTSGLACSQIRSTFLGAAKSALWFESASVNLDTKDFDVKLQINPQSSQL